MSAPSYLLKSRHGIYYFRIRISVATKYLTSRTNGDIRFSLRTRSKKQALYRSRRVWVAMVARSYAANDWEEEADREEELYRLGKKMHARFPGLDPADRFALDELSQHLSNAELKAYIFAWDHDVRQAEERWKRKGKLFASLMGRGLASGETNRHAGASACARSDPPVADAVERFLKANRRKVSTLRAYEPKLGFFIKCLAEWLGNPTPVVSQITSDFVRHFDDTVRRLPRTLPGGTRAHSALGASDDDQIAVKTVNLYLGVVRAFLNWLEEKQYAVTPNLPRIFGSLKRGSDNKRVPFSTSELRLLFESPQYIEGTFKRASDYWVPLIGLLTGAREAELCQLHTDDIYKDESSGLWVIDINGDKDKILKSDSSERRVPVHPTLQKLGLVKFVEEARSANAPRLFPDEHRNSRGEFAGFSKRFNRYKRNIGIKGTMKKRRDFHSFRHNVSGQLSSQGCDEYVINAITGHSQDKRSHSIKTYSTGPSLLTVSKWMKKLDYDIDFTKIKPNGWKRTLNFP